MSCGDSDQTGAGIHVPKLVRSTEPHSLRPSLALCSQVRSMWSKLDDVAMQCAAFDESEATPVFTPQVPPISPYTCITSPQFHTYCYYSTDTHAHHILPSSPPSTRTTRKYAHARTQRNTRTHTTKNTQTYPHLLTLAHLNCNADSCLPLPLSAACAHV